MLNLQCVCALSENQDLTKPVCDFMINAVNHENISWLFFELFDQPGIFFSI